MADIGNDIIRAADYLNNAELVGIPTETVYGLAANAFNQTAVAKIFDVKRRPSFDPLIVHISNLDTWQKCVIEISTTAKKLADAFWPGPLTLVMAKSDLIPDLVSSGLATVGIRMPNHKLTLALLDSLNFPLAAPSANIFGYISPVTAQHVEEGLGKLIPYILNGGKTSIGVESTIVDITTETPQLLRAGGISFEALQKIMPNIQIAKPNSIASSPGSLDNHYAPIKPLLLGDLGELIKEHLDKKISIISYSNSYTLTDLVHNYILSPTNSLNVAASNLFQYMRQADADASTIILAELVPNFGLGVAINDRLWKASLKL